MLSNNIHHYTQTKEKKKKCKISEIPDNNFLTSVLGEQIIKGSVHKKVAPKLLDLTDNTQYRRAGENKQYTLEADLSGGAGISQARTAEMAMC